MKAICFYFQIHQPFRLKRYRFFDIGNDHYYYDDFANDDIITRIAQRSYIPAAESLLRMIEESKGKFRCAISITGHWHHSLIPKSLHCKLKPTMRKSMLYLELSPKCCVTPSLSTATTSLHKLPKWVTRE